MTAEKQHQIYAGLAVVAVILLLGIQFALQYMYRQASEQLINGATQLATSQRNVQNRQKLTSRYKTFKAAATQQTGADRDFPASGRELYMAIAGVLSNYRIDFTNASSTQQVKPGGSFTLSINFKGQYYDVLKALAAIRDGVYIMRVSEFNVAADGQGLVHGTMKIVSTARKS
jgi:hypothetical protein